MGSAACGSASVAVVFLWRRPPRLPRLRLGLVSCSALGSAAGAIGSVAWMGSAACGSALGVVAFLWRWPPRLPRLRFGGAPCSLAVEFIAKGEGWLAVARSGSGAGGSGVCTAGAGRGGSVSCGRRRMLRLGATESPKEKLFVSFVARAIHGHCRPYRDYAL